MNHTQNIEELLQNLHKRHEITAHRAILRHFQITSRPMVRVMALQPLYF